MWNRFTSIKVVRYQKLFRNYSSEGNFGKLKGAYKSNLGIN
jgi:hypothetical protein